jgi:hypothetical protein
MLRRMTGLPSLLTQIAMLRKDPSDLPSSWAVVAVFALLYAAIDVAILALDGGYRVAARTALDVAFAFAFIGLVLGVAGRLHRLPQTVIAIFGAYVLLSPAVIAMFLLRGPARSNGAIQLFTEAASVLIVVWFLLVVGHVLRSALDTGLVTGFAIAVAWTLAGVALSQAVFGAPP